MKILHVCSNYHPAFGGPQYTMKYLSENLVKFYHDEVQVATTNSLYGPEMKMFHEIKPATEIINDVQVYRYPFNRWQYPMIEFSGRVYKKVIKQTLPHSLNKYRWELACNGIKNAMKKSPADVIMATTATYMFSDYPLWRKQTKEPKPFILYGALHLHINWPYYAPVMKRARACDCYIANSEFEKNKLIEYGVEKKRIVSIGTGIDPQTFACTTDEVNNFREMYHILPDDVLIGHIGRLSEGKGVGVLLDSFQMLYQKNKQCKLLLAGTSTPYANELKQKISDENLPVIFLEDFDNMLKPILFNALDIFVLASAGESFGVVFLEAWACKKPVIGAETGAVSNILSAGNDSLLFNPGDKLSLYKKLEVLTTNYELQRKLGENGFKKIMDKYSWPVITKKYRDAYMLGIEYFKADSALLKR